MNRRSYIKTTLFAGALGLSSFAAFKWFDINRPYIPGDFAKKSALLAALAEVIIPETDTPGARTAQVHQYIIGVLSNCMPARQQHKFYAGLESVEQYAFDRFGKSFVACDQQQQQAVVAHAAGDTGYSNRILNKINTKLFGKPFFVNLKDLTVEGYCFSQAGATRGLDYDYIPGRYEACIPLNPNQKSWATK